MNIHSNDDEKKPQKVMTLSCCVRIVASVVSSIELDCFIKDHAVKKKMSVKFPKNRFSDVEYA